MNNFSIIKSHLEYGHKRVDVKTEYGKIAVSFIDVEHVGAFGGLRTYLIARGGHRYDRDSHLFGYTDLIITPIPHRYKKLEVGTKVDVLKEYWLGFFGPYKVTEVTEAVEDLVTIMDTAGTLIRSVPLWAITPHVEGEDDLHTHIKKQVQSS